MYGVIIRKNVLAQWQNVIFKVERWKNEAGVYEGNYD